MTEYHYHDDDHPVLEVQYFTQEETFRQFSELLGSYRYYHDSKPDKENTTSEEADLGQSRELRDRAEIAKYTFLAAFRGIKAPTNQQLLEMPDNQAWQTLQDAIGVLYSNIGLGQESRKETFSSVDKCSNRLGDLTSDSADSNKSSHWPLIRQIRYV